MATSEPRVVGKSLPRMDGAGKVTGTAVYAADFALPGMLVGKVFRSAEPHARIMRLDTARARDRKSTRLNSSHSQISYAVFCLKKKNEGRRQSSSIPSGWSTEQRLPFRTSPS